MKTRHWMIGTGIVALLFAGSGLAWSQMNSGMNSNHGTMGGTSHMGMGLMGNMGGSPMMTQMSNMMGRMSDWTSDVHRLDDRVHAMGSDSATENETAYRMMDGLTMQMDQLVPHVQRMMEQMQSYLNDSNGKTNGVDAQQVRSLMFDMNSMMNAGENMTGSLETMIDQGTPHTGTAAKTTY